MKRTPPLTEGKTLGCVKEYRDDIKRPKSPPPPMKPKPKKFNRLDELKRFIGDSNAPLENPTSIMHNKEVISLQFNGWFIDLYENDWVINDTSGG